MFYRIIAYVLSYSISLQAPNNKFTVEVRASSSWKVGTSGGPEALNPKPWTLKGLGFGVKGLGLGFRV